MTTEVTSKNYKAKCIGPGCSTATCILVRVKNKDKAKAKAKGEPTIKEQRRRYFLLLDKIEKEKIKNPKNDNIGVTEKQLKKLIKTMNKPDSNDSETTKLLKKISDAQDTSIAEETIKNAQARSKELEKHYEKLDKLKLAEEYYNKIIADEKSNSKQKSNARQKIKPILKDIDTLQAVISSQSGAKALDATISKRDEQEDALDAKPYDNADDEQKIEEPYQMVTEGFGSKNAPGEGMYSDQIQEAMRNSPNFSGVISSDQISSLKPANKMNWIQNLDPSDKPGSHWIAVYLDAVDDKEINYFDPLGDPPTDDFMKQIKELIRKINPNTYLKMKINRIPSQNDKSDSCGYQSMNFINKRNQGLGFSQATGFKPQDNTIKGERESNKLKKQLGFGLI